MASNANLSYSCLSGRIYWGRTNEKGVAVGKQRDVTSEFLQVMEMKFPINTYQLISVNGDNKFAIISVDLSKEVVVNGVTYQHGDKSHFVELERQRDELIEIICSEYFDKDIDGGSLADAILAAGFRREGGSHEQ